MCVRKTRKVKRQKRVHAMKSGLGESLVFCVSLHDLSSLVLFLGLCYFTLYRYFASVNKATVPLTF